MARYLEHKDSLDREKELSNETVSEAPPQATPTLTPAKDKKNGDKGEGVIMFCHFYRVFSCVANLRSHNKYLSIVERSE